MERECVTVFDVRKINGMLGSIDKNIVIKTVSWNDGNRSSGCYGSDITDVCIADDKDKVYPVYGQRNYTDQMFKIPADQFVCQVPIANKNSMTNTRQKLLPYVLNHLRTFSKLTHEYIKGKYMKPDEDVYIRIQGIIVETKKSETGTHIHDNVYAYNTYSDKDPQSIYVSMTAHGIGVGTAAKKRQNIYLNRKDKYGKWHNFDRIIAPTVGLGFKLSDRETDESKADAESKGLGTAKCLGLPEFGVRPNYTIVAQIPLIKPTPPPRRYHDAQWNTLGGSSYAMVTTMGCSKGMGSAPRGFTPARVDFGNDCGEVTLPPVPTNVYKRDFTKPVTLTLQVAFAIEERTSITPTILSYVVDTINELGKVCNNKMTTIHERSTVEKIVVHTQDGLVKVSDVTATKVEEDDIVMASDVGAGAGVGAGAEENDVVMATAIDSSSGVGAGVGVGGETDILITTDKTMKDTVSSQDEGSDDESDEESDIDRMLKIIKEKYPDGVYNGVVIKINDPDMHLARKVDLLKSLVDVV